MGSAELRSYSGTVNDDRSSNSLVGYNDGFLLLSPRTPRDCLENVVSVVLDQMCVDL